MQQVGEKIKETFTGSKSTGGYVTIKAFRAKSGKENELENVMKTQWDSLNAAGLTTDRPILYAKSKNGEVVEVLEWKDKDAVKKAEDTPSLKTNWETIKSLTDLVPLATLPEAKDPYAAFMSFCPRTHQSMPTCLNIVVKKPHQGKEKEVVSKMGAHDQALRRNKMLTDKPAIYMQSDDGFYLTACEWRSMEAVQEALKSEEISAIWSQFHQISDVTLLSDLPEAKKEMACFHSMNVA